MIMALLPSRAAAPALPSIRRAIGRARYPRGHAVTRRLRHRDLGDDSCADRDRRRITRNSVLFAAAIAVIVLKEPLRATRVIAALLIVTGSFHPPLLNMRS